jgi:hypothetical protein
MGQKITAADIREFNGYLRQCSHSQVKGVWEKEIQAGRKRYAQLAMNEAQRRALDTSDWVNPGRQTFEQTKDL